MREREVYETEDRVLYESHGVRGVLAGEGYHVGIFYT